MRTMRRWEMEGIGRDRLALRERPIPVPGRHEVLVAVGAVALNHRDKMVIESGRGLPLSFPFIPGSDLAGRIVAMGEDAERFAIGDRVISCFTPDWVDGLRAGTARTPLYRTLGGFFAGVLADYVVLPDHWLVAAPATLDDAQASTLPCAALTAWFALVERGRIRAGDTVLIRGTGGVALFALQFAKMHGATAILSCSPEKKTAHGRWARTTSSTGIGPMGSTRCMRSPTITAQTISWKPSAAPISDCPPRRRPSAVASIRSARSTVSTCRRPPCR